jgi:hypothetical protein
MKSHFVKALATAAMAAALFLLATPTAPGAAASSAAATSLVTEPTDSHTIRNSAGDSVIVGANGVYSVKFASPSWTFVGNLAQEVTDRKTGSGTDKIGEYSEVTFSYKAAVADDGVLRVDIEFAAGESKVTLCGYAPSNPDVRSLAGATGDRSYDPATHLFTFTIQPDQSGKAAVALSVGKPKGGS